MSRRSTVFNGPKIYRPYYLETKPIKFEAQSCLSPCQMSRRFSTILSSSSSSSNGYYELLPQDVIVSKEMGSRAVCIQRVAPPCFEASQVKKNKTVSPFFVNTRSKRRRSNGVRCSSIADYIGGDLVKPDIGRWLQDVEEHKAIAIYTPHEGGYEGRYLNRLKMQGYYFLDISARGLGDPETTLLKNYPVCPAHLGKQPIARWYYPPEVDYRLSALPPSAKGLVVWVLEAKVLSKSELQFLALLPSLRPNVRVIAECGNWRKFMWKPLAEIANLAAQE